MSPLALALALALAQTGEPYVRTRAQDPQYTPPACLYWTAARLTWHQSTLGSARTTGDTEFAAVSRSFASWAEQFSRCGNLQLTEGARVADRNVGFTSSGGNRNLVLFRERACRDVVPAGAACLADGSCANAYDCWDFGADTIGITTVSYDVRSGVIYDADIELNAGGFNFTTVDSPACVGTSTSQTCVSTDVQNTVTHEAGHFLGLDHTRVTGSVMNPEARVGETSKRTLDSGSAGFVCDIYPRGAASVSCVDRPPPPASQDSDGGCASAGALAGLGGLLLLLPALRRRRRRRAEEA